MDVWMDIVCLAILILINGFFAMSEIAIVVSRKRKLQLKADEGSLGAKMALWLADHPSRTLSTVQVGMTSMAILSGIVGENVLVEPFCHVLENILGIPEDIASPVAFVSVVLTITYFSILIGELVPKRIGQMDPEGLAVTLSRAVYFVSVLALPFVKLLSVSTDFLTKVLGVKTKTQALTEEEINSIIEEGTLSGVIDPDEHELVKNVFRLDDRQVSSMMIPRSEIEYLDLEDPLESNIEKIMNSKHSSLPVVLGGLDNIQGIVTLRRVFSQLVKGQQVDFKAILTEPMYVPDSLSGMEALDNFRQNDEKMAFVVDEYGAILGLLTSHDVIEALVGEFKDENDSEASVVPVTENEFDLSGLVSIPEAKDVLSIAQFPDEAEKKYTTIGGLVMYRLGRIPKVGESIVICGWDFTVTRMDGRRVDRLKIVKTPEKRKISETQSKALSSDGHKHGAEIAHKEAEAPV